MALKKLRKGRPHPNGGRKRISALLAGPGTALLMSVILLGTPAIGVAQSGIGAVGVTGQGGTKSGYSRTPSLEGPSGVTTQLSEDDAIQGGLLSPDGTLAAFDPWYAFKRRLNEDYGLQFSISLQSLYQSADETLTGISDAAATRSQIQGAWTLFDRGGSNPGKLTFRIRNRESWNGELAPSRLAYQFGSVVNSGTGFSDAGWDLTELAWRQSFQGGRLRAIGGVISAISWYNTTAMSSSLMGFQNTGMQSSLSKASPGRGLGFGFGYEFTPNTVMVAGVHDANGTATRSPFDTIEHGEHFYSAEFRYLPNGLRKQMWDAVKLQVWYQDALDEKGLDAANGVALQAGYLFDDRWYPFAFGGWSDGDASIFEHDLVAGLGVKLDTRRRASNDMFGIAAGWGSPASDALQDQYTAEMFYRLQLLSSFAITPSVQVVRNPAANPGTDQVVLSGLRTRIQF